MFERHTGENMFQLVVEFLDVMCAEWRAKLIGVSTDGASTMVGSIQGVVTCIEKEVNYKPY